MAILEMLLGRTKPRQPGYNDPWFSPTATSGERVTPETAKGLSAYYACIRNISEDLAKMPIRVGRKVGDTRTELLDHPVRKLLNTSANHESSAMTLRETMMSWAMGWGNGWAEIVRAGGTTPKALWPIHPANAVLERSKAGELFLIVTNGDGTQVSLPYADIFHLHGLGDGLTGESIAAVGCDSIGRAMAIQKHSGAVFAGGGMDRLALEHPGVGQQALSETATDNIRRSWAAQYGGAANTKVAVLSEGMKATRIGIHPKEAQMVEAMTFTVEDLARWFRCPPPKIQHFLRAQGWSTIEHLDMEYVRDTLLGWAIRWEQEIARKLVADSETGVYALHNFKMLLRGDTKTQGEFYRLMREMGGFTVNDVLRLEDMDAIGEEGDVRHIPSGWKVLKVEDEEEDIEDKERGLLPTLPVIEPEGEEDEPEPPTDSAIIEAARTAVVEAWGRVWRKQVKATMGAVKRYLDKGDTEGFKVWCERWFTEHEVTTLETIEPSGRVFDLLSGATDVRAEAVVAHFVSSKAQLLAVLRDEGVDGVKKRCKQWETCSPTTDGTAFITHEREANDANDN